MYHGTSSKDLSSILKTGLKAHPHGTYSQPENKVFATTNKEKAHREADETVKGGGHSGNFKGVGSDPVVLKIHPKVAGKGWKVDQDYHGHYGVEKYVKGKSKHGSVHAFYKNQDIPAHAIEGHYDKDRKFHPNPKFKGPASKERSEKPKAVTPKPATSTNQPVAIDYKHLADMIKKRKDLLAKKEAIPWSKANAAKISAMSSKIGGLARSIKALGGKID